MVTLMCIIAYYYRGEELVEPQASALAKLSAYAVFAAVEATNNASPGVSRCRKRARQEVDTEVI
jgi:hypothetical protein